MTTTQALALTTGIVLAAYVAFKGALRKDSTPASTTVAAVLGFVLAFTVVAGINAVARFIWSLAA